MEAASKRGRRKAVHRGVELVCSMRFEEEARATGHAVVAGVDEVGRGALCGPVVAAAVVLGRGFVAMASTTRSGSRRASALRSTRAFASTRRATRSGSPIITRSTA